MRVGLFAINYATCGDPENAVAVALAAEAAGFESVWTGEHVVLPDPQPPASPLPPTAPMLDTVVALTLIASHTAAVRLGSGIIVLPQRNPLVLAKELASLDVVSAGRLIVGVGAGYLEEEFDALGVPMERRGARMEDYVRAMRAIWTMPRPHYEGEFVSFKGVDAHPRPVQQPSPPVLVAGGSWAALRRAVTIGDGWYGFGLDLARTREAVDALHKTAARYERPAELGQLEITVTPVGGLDAGIVEQYAELGVDRLVLLPKPSAMSEERHLPVPLDDILRNIDLVRRTIVGA
jgi:probable F420-dependent oxidoreductase